MKIVKFNGFKCFVNKGQYQTNNTPALQLMDCIDGSPVATATVNVPYFPLWPGEVIIKNYGENAGILDALKTAGIIRQTDRSVRTGNANCPICEVLI